MRPIALATLVLVAGCGSSPPLDAARDRQGEAATVCPAGPTVEGLDVSGYQTNTDWGQVRGSGRVFAIIKATEGTGYVNPSFGRDWGQAAGAGMVRGAYHFFHPAEDPIAQADRFAQVMGTLGPADLPPALDLEVTDGLSAGAVINASHAFLDRLQADTGRLPLLYTYPSFWESTLGSPGGFGQYPFWPASYQSCPYLPGSFGSWSVWQYSSTSTTVPGITSSTVDVDRYNGAESDLRLFTVQSSGMVQGAIFQHYAALGGPMGFLGYPQNFESGCPDGVGRYNHFDHGSIYWTQATGAWAVGGAIRDRWAALRWEAGPLGYPTTDEAGTPDGLGRYNHFQRGSIYWTAATGAWSITGAIHDKWASLGWETSPVGYPTTDETATPDGVGHFNHFQRGSIYWTPTTGAWSIGGAIQDEWAALGWESSALGYPTTDENKTPDDIGRYNHFQNGSIYWTAATGAHEVRGPIHDTWSALGWEQSALGYPTTDQTAAPDHVGAFNDFQHGSIYWSPDAGAHEVRGAIRSHWLALGGVATLGYPATNELSAQSQGGAFNDFTRSDAIYVCPDAGPALVEGAVLAKWRAVGAEASCLGFPRGDPASSGDQTFQGGVVGLSGGSPIATCSAPDGGSYLVADVDGGVPTSTGTTSTTSSTSTTGTTGATSSTSGNPATSTGGATGASSTSTATSSTGSTGTSTTGTLTSTTGTTGRSTSTAGASTSTGSTTSGAGASGTTTGAGRTTTTAGASTTGGKGGGKMGGCGVGVDFSPLALLALGLLAWRRRTWPAPARGA